MVRRSLLLLAALLGAGAFALLSAREPNLRPDEAPPDLGSLERRLEAPLGDWQALWEAGEAGESAAELVAAIARHLEDENPVARRLAAEALGKIGAKARDAQPALRRAYHRGDALLDHAIEQALTAIGEWVPFDAELPEPITFASTPCLEALEAAASHDFVRAEDLPLLERCREEARAHARRMERDHAFRLGEQVRANVAATMPDHLEPELRWSPPFLLIALDDRRRAEPTGSEEPGGPAPLDLRSIAERQERFGALLDGCAEVCQAVYRDVLALQGRALGHGPLEAPYGGRPDLPVHRRSYADGYPLQVWILVGRGAAQNLSSERARGWWLSGNVLPPGVVASVDYGGGGRAVLIADDVSGRRDSVPAGLTAWVAAASLQRAFESQRAAWKAPRNEQDALGLALTQQWASWQRSASGALERASVPWAHPRWTEFARENLRSGKRPWFRLEHLLAFDSSQDAMEHAMALGLDPRVGAELARAQAWAFCQLLATHADPARRAQWDQLVRRRLDGRLTLEEIGRVLGVRDGDGWAALDEELAPWLETAFAPPAPPGPSAAEPK